MPSSISWHRFSTAFLTLLLGGAFVGWYLLTRDRTKCPSPTTKSYEVHFKWRGTLIDLRAIDTSTGKEEPSEQFRRVIQKESQDIAKKITASTHLDNADGSFALALSGCAEPYLTTWNSANIPQLSDFLAAAQTWNVEELRKILATGINVNARDFGNHTALMLAAADPRKELQQHPDMRAKVSWEPDIAAVKLLLAAGADPNVKGNYSVTPLMLADSSTASILLGAGADVNSHDDFGKTPLMYMAEKGEADVLKLELTKHADVNARDRDGWTALMYAANKGSIESLKTLLAAGSDRYAKNAAGQTALGLAIDRAKEDSRFRYGVDLLSRNN